MKKLLVLAPLLILPVLLNLSCMEGGSVLQTENLPPEEPTNPFPADSATGISTESVTLRWECADPNWDDLTYTVFWRHYYSYHSIDSATGLTTPSHTIPALSFGATYRWWVVAADGDGEIVSGPSWRFTTEDTVVNFPDYYLEMSIRQLLRKPTGDIYASDVSNLYYFHVYNSGISSLIGTEYMIGLRWLALDNNLIADVSPLSGLTQLDELSLNDNLITNPAPLASLTRLRSLTLNNNQISDLSFVTNLTQLWYLGLSGCQISDLSPLSGMNYLYSLTLTDNQITDISPLSENTHLSRLYLGQNQISDLSPLSGLDTLYSLWINNNQISDLSPLSETQAIQNLYLHNNQITDISPLSNLVLLSYLELENNAVEDISALENLALLYLVNLAENMVTNIEPLVNNLGINYGDTIYLLNNPLDSVSINIYIPELQARGVTVNY